jgi:hypothetical protein
MLLSHGYGISGSRGRPTTHRRIASAQDEQQVMDLLEQVAHAFRSGDGRAVAPMWEMPALIVGPVHVLTLKSSIELETHFQEVRSHYNSLGIMSARPELERLEEITDHTRLAEVRWVHLDEDGGERGEEVATYLLRRNDVGDYRLRAAVHGSTVGHPLVEQ